MSPTNNTRRFTSPTAFLLIIVSVCAFVGASMAIRDGALEVVVAWHPEVSSTPVWAAVALVLLFTFPIYIMLRGNRANAARATESATGDSATDSGRKQRGASDANLVVERPTTRFTDVAGVAEAKEELAEIIDFLRDPDRYQAVGARIPRGVLLVGPPGNGKTLLARAVAGEAGVAFLRTSGSDFVEMYVGVGASRVRKLFKAARGHGRAIIFIDEIDAVGRRRGGSASHTHEEREQTLNQLLVEMDGFDPRSRIIVLAATNRPDVLDPALLRPGRFDRRVQLDPPDAPARRKILDLHADGKPIDPSVDMDLLVRQTVGLSGADLENLLNEAAILCARECRAAIVQADLDEALDRVTAGPRRKARSLSSRERHITAVHELGHAVVAHFVPSADPVRKVSIVSRGSMGGYTRMAPDEDRRFWTREQFEASLAAALGGHVAEELTFGQVTTGASNDLRRATDIARAMVCDYGMSPKLGPIALGGGDQGGFYRVHAERTAERVDAEVTRLVEQARQYARHELVTHADMLDGAVRDLLERETFDAHDMLRHFGPRPEVPSIALPGELGDAPPAAPVHIAAAPTSRRQVTSRPRPALGLVSARLLPSWGWLSRRVKGRRSVLAPQ
jgi:cell division protease FtsH